MAPDQKNDQGKKDQQQHKIDRTAPAGSENSLGAQSIRDGRPATDDSTVEAIDEMEPGTTGIRDNKKQSQR
jgi:hypothetical protein